VSRAGAARGRRPQYVAEGRRRSQRPGPCQARRRGNVACCGNPPSAAGVRDHSAITQHPDSAAIPEPLHTERATGVADPHDLGTALPRATPAAGHPGAPRGHARRTGSVESGVRRVPRPRLGRSRETTPSTQKPSSCSSSTPHRQRRPSRPPVWTYPPGGALAQQPAPVRELDA